MSYKPGSHIADAVRNDTLYLKNLARQRDKRMRAKKAVECSPQKADKQIDRLIKELNFSD